MREEFPFVLLVSGVISTPETEKVYNDTVEKVIEHYEENKLALKYKARKLCLSEDKVNELVKWKEQLYNQISYEPDFFRDILTVLYQEYSPSGDLEKRVEVYENFKFDREEVYNDYMRTFSGDKVITVLIFIASQKSLKDMHFQQFISEEIKEEAVTFSHIQKLMYGCDINYFLNNTLQCLKFWFDEDELQSLKALTSQGLIPLHQALRHCITNRGHILLPD